jgi:hypothetical protein
MVNTSFKIAVRAHFAIGLLNRLKVVHLNKLKIIFLKHNLNYLLEKVAKIVKVFKFISNFCVNFQLNFRFLIKPKSIYGFVYFYFTYNSLV